MNWLRLAPIALAAVAPTKTLAIPCLKYEPAEVQLSGTIVRKTFPGPPNYESVESGDAPETVWILTLSKPICTVGSQADDMNEAETNQTDVQLVLKQPQYQKFRALIGSRVTATGTLFHAENGHHHETLLLATKTLRQISQQRLERVGMDKVPMTVAVARGRSTLS